MNTFLGQVRAETILTLRRGESVLVTLLIPVMLLVFFSTVDVVEVGSKVRSTAFLPGVIAVAVMSSAMTSLGIATGFERHYQVLKRLGGTPLKRSTLIFAKISSIMVVEVIQVVMLIATAILLGSRAPANPAGLLISMFLGTAAFAGIGLLMAGSLPGEMNLAVNNALFIALTLLGGAIVPAVIDPVDGFLPLLPLKELAGWGIYGGQLPAGWIGLALWAVVAPIVAALSFSWD